MQYSRLSTDAEAEQLAPYPEERRLTLRLWRYWNSLRGDRLFPALSDFEVDTIGDLANHAFMLDFRESRFDPTLNFVGRELRQDGDSDPSSLHVSKLDKSSVLAQAVGHYSEVFRRRGPVGLEDSYTNAKGDRFEFRGILLPFTDEGSGIDFIVGAVTHRNAVAVPAAPQSAAEPVAERAPEPVASIGAAAPAEPEDVAEAEKPADDEDRPDPIDTRLVDYVASVDSLSRRAAALNAGVSASTLKLAESLRECRSLAQQFAAVESRSREALYRMLGRAYRFHFEAEAAPAAFLELCSAFGIKSQDRAPFTPIVKLAFGPDYDKTRLSEYATVLRYAKRTGQTTTSFARFLENQEGGIKGCVQAERRASRGDAAPSTAKLESARAALRHATSVGRLPDADAGGAEFVVLIGRRRPGAGGLEVLDIYEEAPSVVDRIVRRAAKLLGKSPRG